MQAGDINREIRAFIVNTFLSGRDDKLGENGSLLGDVIDSSGVISLVMYLQEHFNITIEDEEIVPANLDSVDSLVSLVAKKLSLAAEPK